MNDAPVSLQQWLDALDEHLGTHCPVDEESITILLDLARDAAHEVVRPAAPLSTFLVGVAVGRGASLEQAATAASELALTIGEQARGTGDSTAG